MIYGTWQPGGDGNSEFSLQCFEFLHHQGGTMEDGGEFAFIRSQDQVNKNIQSSVFNSQRNIEKVKKKLRCSHKCAFPLYVCGMCYQVEQEKKISVGDILKKFLCVKEYFMTKTFLLSDSRNKNAFSKITFNFEIHSFIFNFTF